MAYGITYMTERYMVEIEAKTYIEGFRIADYFLEFCQQCGNFGRRYGCPPFDYDPRPVTQKYEKVRYCENNPTSPSN